MHIVPIILTALVPLSLAAPIIANQRALQPVPSPNGPEPTGGPGTGASLGDEVGNALEGVGGILGGKRAVTICPSPNGPEEGGGPGTGVSAGDIVGDVLEGVGCILGGK